MLSRKMTVLMIILFLGGVLAACIDNAAPIADAGRDKTLYGGQELFVELTGEGSFDPNGDTLTFHWSLDRVPPGSNAELNDFHSQDTSFSVDKFGVYEVSLIVDDGKLRSQKDRIKIQYYEDVNQNPPPIGGGHHPIDMRNLTCISCHNGIEAGGKSTAHILTINECDHCHSMDIWMPVIRVDHTVVIGECVDCHNGVVATGKSVNHLPTNDSCDTCHSEFAWFPIISDGSNKPPIYFDHTGIIDGCVNCHNNVSAVGKPANHFPASDECSTCHMTSTFQVAIFVDHTEVLGSCESCHNGVIATGMTSNHIATSDQCAACHLTVIWSPVVMVDHNEVFGHCVNCHLPPEQHVAVGVKGACEVCHSVNDWSQPTAALPSPIP